MEKPRIEFYRQRTFSEKLNATFDFIRENWKPLLKYAFYLIMPICLIQSFAINSVFDIYLGAMRNSAVTSSFDSSIYSIAASYGVMLLCMMIGMALLSGLIYAMMQTYATRENRLLDITLSDFKEALIRNAWKYLRITFLTMFASLFIGFAMAILAYVSTMTLILTIPLFFVLMILTVPLMMMIPVYIFERDIKLFGAIIKAWKLGIATIWSMLGFMVVIYIISSVIQSVTMMPWYLTVLIGSVFSFTSESAIDQSVIYKFAVYILGLIQSFGMYISVIIGIVGLAFHYFHAREKVEGITIESNISNFNEL